MYSATMQEMISKENITAKITVAVCSGAGPITYSHLEKRGKSEALSFSLRPVYISKPLLPVICVTGLPITCIRSQHSPTPDIYLDELGKDVKSLGV